jgi:CRISPR type I-F-associated protein Csy2
MSMDRDVVIVGPYRLNDAAGYTGQGVVGVTPPTASVGFAHAIERDVIARVHSDLRIPAVGVVVHSAEQCQGHPKFPPSDAKLALGKGPIPGSEVIDDIKMRASVTFVFAVDSVGDDYDREERLAEFADAIQGLLKGRRYAGGSLFPERAGKISSGVIPPSEQRAALRALPRGYMLRDRRDILEGAVASGTDRLQAILDLAALDRPVSGGAATKVVRGATVPITVGYRTIETPRMRRTSRHPEPALHAFADSLTSAGEWVFTRRLAAAREGSPFADVLWSPWADVDLGLFYASALEAPATPGSKPCTL